jgi:hypothetical protein
MAAMNFEPRIFCSRFSEDTGADEERKKVIKKFQRWVRFPTNDRCVPAMISSDASFLGSCAAGVPFYL